MDDSRTVPVVPASQAETFWNEGHAAFARSGALQPESQPDGFAGAAALPDDTPIDYPGVGAVRPGQDPERLPAPTIPGRPYVVGEVPEPLRGFLDDLPKFNKLLCQVPFAAKDVVEWNTQYSPDHRTDVCRECLVLRERGAETIQHGIGCRIGRLAELVQGLEKLAKFPPQIIGGGEGVADNRQSLADGRREAIPAPAANDFSEPWSTDGGSGLEVAGEYFFLRTADDSLSLSDLFPGVMRRIVACINFCAEAVTLKLEDSAPLHSLRVTADCPAIKALFERHKGGAR
jgi:hypothetical protein